MKKYYQILMALLMAAVSLVFCSCGSDDDDDDSVSNYAELLVGNWKQEDSEHKMNLTYTSNGSFTWVVSTSQNVNARTTGTYSVNGNMLSHTLKDVEIKINGEWKSITSFYGTIYWSSFKSLVDDIGKTDTDEFTVDKKTLNCDLLYFNSFDRVY